MPEVLLVDEMPDADPGDLGSDVAEGTVPCPECGDYFKSRGLSRHLNSAHGIEPARKQASGTGKSKTPALATQWAEFQRGAALLISFACTGCAGVLVEDAEVDGIAIAAFCETRPKLRKQIQQALAGMDVMILVGALGGTAKKMVSHHSIGARIGLGGEGHSHSPVQGSAEQKMMAFLTQMPEDSRNQLLNQVFSGMATAPPQQQAAAPQPVVTVVHDDEPVPGEPPVEMPDHLTEQDKYQMAMAHSGTPDFVETL
jgi:uncharacterized C2H2 Zn-finger protein